MERLFNVYKERTYTTTMCWRLESQPSEGLLERDLSTETPPVQLNTLYCQGLLQGTEWPTLLLTAVCAGESEQDEYLSPTGQTISSMGGIQALGIQSHNRSDNTTRCPRYFTILFLRIERSGLSLGNMWATYSDPFIYLQRLTLWLWPWSISAWCFSCAQMALFPIWTTMTTMTVTPRSPPCRNVSF